MPTPLTPELVEAAYRKGFFPMASEDGEIRWYGSDPRAIIELDHFHIPKRLLRMIRSKKYTMTTNQDFEAVIRGCADREETWISEEIISVYIQMHRLHKAHSVEAYRDGRMVGGIYGVSLGGAFMGESMFSLESGGSSACLVYLLERLLKKGYELFDTQFITQHLQRFGAVEISRYEYLRRLKKALELPCRF